MKTLQLISQGTQVCSDLSRVADRMGEYKIMFEKVIKEHGKIDILVNNAAIYNDSTVWKMDKEIWME